MQGWDLNPQPQRYERGDLPIDLPYCLSSFLVDDFVDDFPGKHGGSVRVAWSGRCDAGGGGGAVRGRGGRFGGDAGLQAQGRAGEGEEAEESECRFHFSITWFGVWSM